MPSGRAVQACTIYLLQASVIGRSGDRNSCFTPSHTMKSVEQQSIVRAAADFCRRRFVTRLSLYRIAEAFRELPR
jgi:hypothetical protein